MTLLAFTTLTLLPPQAYAGHYTVSYSGGTVNGQPYTGNGPYGGSMGSSQVTCSGTITATFTWVPDYPGDSSVAPPAVVIKETCLAQWYANGGGANVQYSGSADDGFGDPAQATTRPGQISQGVRYEIRQSDTPGAPVKSFSVQCSPKVSASATPNGVVVGVVQFTATPAPLMVVLGGSGINLNTRPEYLIGQQVTCSLNPGGLTPSNYQWNPPAACQPFKDWQLSNYLNGDTSQPQSAKFIPLAAADLTQSTLIFYPKVPTATNQSSTRVVVTCTVDLAVPAGAHPAGGFPATKVTSLSVNFDAPTLKNPFTLQFSLDANQRSVDIVNGTLMLIRAAFDAIVQTPPQFYRPTEHNVYGAFGLCQLVAPQLQLQTNVATYSLQNNGALGLDTQFPEARKAVIANGNYNLGYVDQPGWVLSFQFFNPKTQQQETVLSYTTTESFQDWLMYRPPGDTSWWVPLDKYSYTWQGKAVAQNGNWVLQNPNGAQIDAHGPSFPPFPEWNLLWTGNFVIVIP